MRCACWRGVLFGSGVWRCQYGHLTALCLDGLVGVVRRTVSHGGVGEWSSCVVFAGRWQRRGRCRGKLALRRLPVRSNVVVAESLSLEES